MNGASWDALSKLTWDGNRPLRSVRDVLVAAQRDIAHHKVPVTSDVFLESLGVMSEAMHLMLVVCEEQAEARAGNGAATEVR